MKAKFIGENKAKSVTFRGCEFPAGKLVEVKGMADGDTEKLEAMLVGHPEFEISKAKAKK